MSLDSNLAPEDWTSRIVTMMHDPASYPERPAHVTLRETHMAWVFLTDSYAYKLKKSVRTSYLDYSTYRNRRAACEAEIRLNSRLSPWVYLGMVPILHDGEGHLHLDAAEGAPVEWIVKMRRLPDEALLDNAIAAGGLKAAALDPAATLLANFFRGQPRHPLVGDAFRESLALDIDTDVEAVAAGTGRAQKEQAENLGQRLKNFLAAETALMAERAERRVEGHGDLRPDHIYLGSPPAVIDCIEFNRAFRFNDPVEELAFLKMACTRLNAGWVGDFFLDTYARIANDAPPARLVAFYAAKRAMLRAKLALWHIDDTTVDSAYWHKTASNYLDLAGSFMSEAERAG